MGKKSKVNPNRKPVSRLHAEQNVRDHAIKLCWAMFFTVLHDKEDYGPKRCRRVWNHIAELSSGITSGYVRPQELMDVLEKEVGIRLK